MPAKKIDWL
uniref:Uncharacterized protein n=1 Tax=Anguilla anguilla TaxID=7936 RepID=A0A0E9TJE8_ANGAN